MRKPDDNSLTAEEYRKVRAEAERALLEAGAIGQYPTPVSDIMVAANVEEVHEDVLNEPFIAKMRHKANGSLKQALKKVMGLFDAISRLIFIDRSLLTVKQTFIRLHETGHGFMKWQRDLYAVVEECEHSISPDIADLFDREANVFASEVLFQLDGFSNDAEKSEFGIMTPVRLSNKYGASIYASIRRYTSMNRRTCAVIVLNKPELIAGDGFRASVRRFIPSKSFNEQFGELDLPEYFTPDDKIGAFVPANGRGASGKHIIVIEDVNGASHECVAEAFGQSYQVFVLIHVTRALTATSILV